MYLRNRRSRLSGLSVALLLTPLLGFSCTDESSAEGAESSQADPGEASSEAAGSSPVTGDAETRGEIRDLVRALTPPAATATAGFKNDWYERRRATMKRLRKAGPEFGRAVLSEYHAKANAIPEVRGGLLDVASHCVPQETAGLLTVLITTFGEPLALRTQASDIMAQTSPATAIEVLGPILEERKHRITYPPEERMLQAWVRAADQLGIDKSAFLGDIAVQLEREHSTRQAAVRALETCSGPAAIEALKSLMVESSGNHLLRRTATQSLLAVLPRDEFCAYARDVFELESDQGFQLFLADVLDDNCSG